MHLRVTPSQHDEHELLLEVLCHEAYEQGAVTLPSRIIGTVAVEDPGALEMLKASGLYRES